MTSAEHFISLITVTSAKKLATALIICFIVYHGAIHLIYGTILKDAVGQLCYLIAHSNCTCLSFSLFPR